LFDQLYERSLYRKKNDSGPNMRCIAGWTADDRRSPVVPLWYDEVFRLVNPRVRHFTANGLNLLELRRVTIDE